MKYENIEKAIFKARPNRFLAEVELHGQTEICHVKNTGRCRELLIPGAVVYVQHSDHPNRKTKLDLIGVEKGRRLINMDSQIPNRVVEEWLRKGNLVSTEAYIKPECRFGSSRFDFYAEDGARKLFIEVKGVTLEEDGVARFPDAPTERGVKHILELCDCMEKGYEAYIIFVIQMEEIRYFSPNWKTHAAFGEALRMAREKGVQILAYTCYVDETSIEMKEKTEVRI